MKILIILLINFILFYNIIKSTDSPTNSPSDAPLKLGETILVSSYQKISDTEGSFLTTTLTSKLFGYSLSTLLDINNDNIDDLVVGSIYDSDGAWGTGAIYMIFLLTTAKVDTYIKISKTSGGFTNAALDGTDYFGSSVSDLNDLDNDLIKDIGVGAMNDSDGNTWVGCIYIIHLQSSGLVKTFIKISSTEGSFNITFDYGDFFGRSISSLKDINDDGMNDVGVGATGDDDGDSQAGAIYLIMLKTNSKVKTYIKISKTSGGMTNSDLDGSDTFGNSISLIGGHDDDLDQDGVNDIMSGASGTDGNTSGPGLFYILFMKTDNTVKTHVKISNTSGSFTAAVDVSDTFGAALSPFGRWSNADVDGDNIQDVIVGANGDDDGGANEGAIYLIMLETTGFVKTYSKISATKGSFDQVLNNGDAFGRSVSSFGKDITNDGLIDIVVGTSNDNAVYVLSLTVIPTISPTPSPTTLAPTMRPTIPPTPLPTTSPPTMIPTSSPTLSPTSSPTPSILNSSSQIQFSFILILLISILTIFIVIL